MSSVLVRESAKASLSLVMPLSAPSPETAWEFLQWAVPTTVFSSGSGRRRRRGEQLRSIGQRSDQGYLLFYRRSAAGQVIQQPLKSPTSIQAYLRQQVVGEPAEHWVATQITQYRTRHDGRGGSGWTTDTARHILGLVVDLDGSRMAPPYQYLLQTNFYAFSAALADLLGAVGVTEYRLIRSGPEGVHIHIPLIRPDGKPLRAKEKTMAVWERVARALARYLSELGADSNAVKAVQPFAIPGLPRAKHPGFVPYIAGGRDGQRADLYALLRRLSALKQVMAQERGLTPSPTTSGPVASLETILADIRERASGVGAGERNQVAHDVATYLLAKGADSGAAWDAMEAWNRRNDPPLPERELRGCYRSAERTAARHPGKWAEMQRAPWARLRGVLGLPKTGTGFLLEGRWRPVTPARTWEERKLSGGREHYEELEERLLGQVEAQDGRWETTQGELAELLGAAVSSLKVVLQRLVASGRIQVLTRRGRGGRTVLVLPGTLAVADAVNSQSRISSVAVQQGAWVGDSVVDPPEAPTPRENDGSAGGMHPGSAPAPSLNPISTAVEILRERGVNVAKPPAWLAVWAGQRLILRSREGIDALLQMFAGLGYAEELGRRLGIEVEIKARRRPSFDAGDWARSRESDEPSPEGDPSG